MNGVKKKMEMLGDERDCQSRTTNEFTLAKGQLTTTQKHVVQR